MINASEIRIGHGYDFHRLIPGKGMTLAGVWIPADYAIEAHSDGDVVLHALCDAAFGALAMGDIGDHFSDSDARWKDADSTQFWRYCLEKLEERKLVITHMDVSIILQLPKLSPHKMLLKANLAKITGLDLDRVNIKATTKEGLDSIGNHQAIACHAVLLVAPINLS